MSSSRLGKGFSALMGERSVTTTEQAVTSGSSGQTGVFAELPLNSIEADPQQPRKLFAAKEIESLAESLQTHGLLEPVVVHQTAPGRYRLIAGERRLRAATRLGWASLPAVVRSAHPQTSRRPDRCIHPGTGERSSAAPRFFRLHPWLFRSIRC